MKGLFILTEMRSGSSWTCSLTNRTGKLGNAVEHLRLAAITPEIDAASTHARILNDAGTDNGVFAVKMFPSQFERFHDCFGYDFIERCRQEHDITFVLLDRKDRLSQAVSAVKAMQTQLWSSEDEKIGKPDPGEAVPSYDFQWIMKSLEMISESTEYWRTYLATRDLPFIHSFYEDILNDRKAYVDKVCESLGVDPARWISRRTPVVFSATRSTTNGGRAFSPSMRNASRPA